MNYDQNVTYLTQYAGDSGYSTDPDFQAQLPIFAQSGELRILRDLDLLSTRVTDATGALSPNNRLLTLPDQSSNPWQVVETVALRMNYQQGVTGTLFTQPPLEWVSKEFLDAAYPDDHAVGAPSVPRYIAPYTDKVYAVGPAAGLAYPFVVYGTQFPQPLSAANETSFVSINLPDLLLASEMMSVQLWEKQFGLVSDEAQGAVDWAAEYEKLKSAADVMELRRKIQASGWGKRAPDPIAKT